LVISGDLARGGTLLAVVVILDGEELDAAAVIDPPLPPPPPPLPTPLPFARINKRRLFGGDIRTYTLSIGGLTLLLFGVIGLLTRLLFGVVGLLILFLGVLDLELRWLEGLLLEL
jgi:hypothetical protein